MLKQHVLNTLRAAPHQGVFTRPLGATEKSWHDFDRLQNWPPPADEYFSLNRLAAVNGNWWIGLSSMHTLFTREHTAIVDRLHIEYPDKDGEWLFQKARLINAALIAKIHATEWTPALLQSPTLQYAMRGSWWGVLGQAYFKAFGRPLHNELLSGIPNSPQEHYAAPYAITEEFTAVYRLHSLIPDDYSFRRHGDDKELLACTLADLFAGGTTRVHRSEPFEDVLYSLGTSYPGLPVLHNFPTHLRKIPEKPGTGDLHRPRRHRHPA